VEGAVGVRDANQGARQRRRNLLLNIFLNNGCRRAAVDRVGHEAVTVDLGSGKGEEHLAAADGARVDGGAVDHNRRVSSHNLAAHGCRGLGDGQASHF